MRPAAALGLIAALAGCPDKGDGKPQGDERLLAKLKAEKEREAREGAFVPPARVEPMPRDEQVNPLAEFAAKGTQKRALALPAKTALDLGKASLRLEGLEATHTVGSGIAITTDDWFVKVAFSAAGPAGTEVDLTVAHLESEGRAFPFARDAQAASHLPARVSAGPQGVTVTAHFEVPAESLGKSLTLVVPDGTGAAKLELQ